MTSLSKTGRATILNLHKECSMVIMTQAMFHLNRMIFDILASHDFVYALIMKFGTGIKVDEFYTMVTKV